MDSTFYQTTPSKTPYSLRAVADDDEPTTRGTVTTINADQVKNLSPLSVQYNSKGRSASHGAPEAGHDDRAGRALHGYVLVQDSQRDRGTELHLL